MFTILLHSSKTMRQATGNNAAIQVPALIESARELGSYLKSLSHEQIASSMKLSDKKSLATYDLIHDWDTVASHQLPAIDAFLGDIYSGLQVQSFSGYERARANQSLYILSGLYGVLRALDSVCPYRLEMGYRLPNEPYKNLYAFWADSIARQLPHDTTIINLSAVEYTKAVFPHLAPSRSIISPRFLTRDASTGEPKFVVVHAKIARGAFAHWLITNDIQSESAIQTFDQLNYHYDDELSTPNEPVFICKTFGGLGLSVRLT